MHEENRYSRPKEVVRAELEEVQRGLRELAARGKMGKKSLARGLDLYWEMDSLEEEEMAGRKEISWNTREFLGGGIGDHNSISLGAFEFQLRTTNMFGKPGVLIEGLEGDALERAQKFYREMVSYNRRRKAFLRRQSKTP